jgi:hypothetical protein
MALKQAIRVFTIVALSCNYLYTSIIIIQLYCLGLGRIKINLLSVRLRFNFGGRLS